MSRPAFLADHDFTDAIVRGLKDREPAIDIVRAREIGLAQASDSTILEFSAGEGRIVLSCDHRTMIGTAYNRIRNGEPMAGLYMVEQGDPIGPVVEDLIVIWACSEAEEWRDRVLHFPI